MSNNKSKQKKNEQKHMPTFSKSVRICAIAREAEQYEKMMQSNALRNQVLLQTRARNYQMEGDRLNGIISQNRLVNNRDPRLELRRDLLRHHINYMEPIIGYQGRYTHV